MFHKILRYRLLGYRLKMLRPVSRSRHSGLGWSALGSIGLSWALAMPPGAIAPAYAAELAEWRFDPTTRQLELSIPGGTTPNYFLLAQPARIVLDLPNTTVSNPLEEQTYSGVVRSIRVSQFQPTLTRIVIELSPDAELAPAQVELRQVAPPDTSAREQWIVRPLLAGDAPVAAIEPVPPTPAPAGLDAVPEETDPEETDGVIFEPGTDVVNGTDGDIDADESVMPQGIDLFDLATRNDRAETAMANAAGADEPDDRLPPLEPGAFEIPVEIPPPLPELEEPPAQSLTASGAADGEADVEVLPDDMIVDAPDDEESASLPVAIAPPAPATLEAESHEDIAEEDNTSANASTFQDERESATPGQDVIRTPDDLEQALADALPEGTNITVVGREGDPPPSQQRENETTTPDEAADTVSSVPPAPDLSDIPQPEQQLPDPPQASDNVLLNEMPSSEMPSSEIPSSEISTSDPSLVAQPDDANIAASTDSPHQDNFPTEDSFTFPSPGEDDTESFAVSPIAADFLSALPPAQSTLDLPVTVTVPSLDKADDETIADPSDSDTISGETASDEPDSTAEASQWDIQPDSTRPFPEPEQAPSGQQDAQVPPDPAISLHQSSPSVAPTAPTIARTDDAPVNVIEFGQPIDGQPSIPPSPGQATGVRPSGISQPGSFPTPSSLQQQPALASPSVTTASGRQLVVAARPDAMIPSGTVLRLRYPRLTPTLLRKGIAWQDVLLLEQTLLDPDGNVIAIEGTPVIGRFEITPQYIRFVTQAIALNDRNIPLQAISGWVPVPVESTAVVIQPNQIVNVRLAENFDR